MPSSLIQLRVAAELERRIRAAALPQSERKKAWREIARVKQLPPEQFFVWLILAGRGFGKTRTGSEWLDEQARTMRPGEQVLLAGRTPGDVNSYALYGPGGLITNHPDIVHVESKRELRWPNGVVGIIRSGANPEEFRGFSGRKAWCDELGAWQYPDLAWNNLLFGMREIGNPQVVVTTTPRPLEIIRRLIKTEGCVTVTGSSHENAANLDPRWVKNVLNPLKGTRIGRQEIDAEILDDVVGALWTLSQLDGLRVSAVPPLKRVVIGVDPQGKKDERDRDDRPLDDAARRGLKMTGIVACGRSEDDRLYTLEDASMTGTPLEWARTAVACFDKWTGDHIVGEANFGGQMVESTVRAVRELVPFKMVTASRGKYVRAEPVSTLYEMGRAFHLGHHSLLEDEMTRFTKSSDWSPNRLDALVWAATELFFADEPVIPVRPVWGR